MRRVWARRVSESWNRVGGGCSGERGGGAEHGPSKESAESRGVLPTYKVPEYGTRTLMSDTLELATLSLSRSVKSAASPCSAARARSTAAGEQRRSRMPPHASPPAVAHAASSAVAIWHCCWQRCRVENGRSCAGDAAHADLDPSPCFGGHPPPGPSAPPQLVTAAWPRCSAGSAQLREIGTHPLLLTSSRPHPPSWAGAQRVGGSWWLNEASSEATIVGGCSRACADRLHYAGRARPRTEQTLCCAGPAL